MAMRRKDDRHPIMLRMQMLRDARLGALALLMASSLAAQGNTQSDGTLAITAAEVRRHVDVIAADSMHGRDTPSPGLETTAQYVADQFQALGLRPAGDPVFAARALHGIQDEVKIPWMQRYPVPGTLRASSGSSLTFTARLSRTGQSVVDEQGQAINIVTPISFTTAARFAVDTVPESGGVGMWAQSVAVQTQMPLLTGRHTPESIRRALLGDGVVLYVPPIGTDSIALRRVVQQLTETSHVVVLVDEDSATFAARQAAALGRPSVVVDRALEHSSGRRHWAAYVWPGALGGFLRAARLDVAALRADTTPKVRGVPTIGVLIQPAATRPEHDTATVMNVAAILPGTDTLLRDQFIVISAHMDGTGVTSGQADSLRNGADDNASGVAGLLALAKAFSQPGARPKRPLLFVATSGGASGKQWWGANAFAEPAGLDVVYSLNVALDMIGHGAGDSLLINGLSDFDFATRPDWVALQHPELKVKLIDGGSIFDANADPMAFVQRAVPSLYFHVGTHEESTAVADTPAAVDAEHEARLLRLLYYVTQDLANASRLPRWTAAARQERLRLFGR